MAAPTPAAAARERQAVAIADLDARHRRDLPTFIAGDFNAGPDAASIRYLTGRQSLDGRSLYRDAWAIAGQGPGYTWSSDNPNAKAGAEQIVRQQDDREVFDHASNPSDPKPGRLRLALQRPSTRRYASFEYSVTQAIAAAAFFLDFNGLIVPSARSTELNLVIFTEKLGVGEQLKLEASEPVDWPMWDHSIGSGPQDR